MSADLPKPDYAHNMRIIGHCDQGGRPDGVQIMVHRGYAYIGHMFSKGFSVVDVRDARNPRAVNYLPAPPNTWNIHLQTHDSDIRGQAIFAQRGGIERLRIGPNTRLSKGSAKRRCSVVRKRGVSGSGQ